MRLLVGRSVGGRKDGWTGGRVDDSCGRWLECFGGLKNVEISSVFLPPFFLHHFWTVRLQPSRHRSRLTPPPTPTTPFRKDAFVAFIAFIAFCLSCLILANLYR
ncbi:hypothetical protein TcWFU_008531 [Taenia crassiceps]|uniref:Uncharacterized protein n=1 Tax=Taenia crassiceps TaxID=6207 RepID=A0ABR4Q0A9_9CEST